LVGGWKISNSKDEFLDFNQIAKIQTLPRVTDGIQRKTKKHHHRFPGSNY
jgi:hypothetical protein